MMYIKEGMDTASAAKIAEADRKAFDELSIQNEEHLETQLKQQRRSAHLRQSDIDELAKASTAGMGNRKERRRRQAEFKKLMRKG